MAVVADNGAVVEAGGVYLVRIQPTDRPYLFAKVVTIGGRGYARKWVVPPGGGPDPSPDLWLRLYDGESAEPPPSSSLPPEEFAVVPISTEVFLAWCRASGSALPSRVGTEAVTEEEVAAVVGWTGP